MIMSLINRTKWIKNFLIAINSKYLILRIFTKFREISWVFNLRKNFCAEFSRKKISWKSDEKIDENIFAQKFSRKFFSPNSYENIFVKNKKKIFEKICLEKIFV